MIKRQWKRYCDSNACVEVMETDQEVLLRKSNDPNRIVAITFEEWEQFLAGAKAGVFNLQGK